LGKTDTRAAGIDDGYRFCQATAQLGFNIVLVFCDAQYSVNYFMIHGNLTMMKVGLFLVLNACFSLIAWNGDCYGFTGGSRGFTLSHVDTIICYYLLLLSVAIIIIINFFFLLVFPRNNHDNSFWPWEESRTLHKRQLEAVWFQKQ